MAYVSLVEIYHLLRTWEECCSWCGRNSMCCALFLCWKEAQLGFARSQHPSRFERSTNNASTTRPTLECHRSVFIAFRGREFNLWITAERGCEEGRRVLMLVNSKNFELDSTRLKNLERRHLYTGLEELQKGGNTTVKVGR